MFDHPPTSKNNVKYSLNLRPPSMFIRNIQGDRKRKKVEDLDRVQECKNAY